MNKEEASMARPKAGKKAPTPKTEEYHTCPRRAEGAGYRKRWSDTWQMRGEDKCCSYCGSLHPERMLELMRIHGPEIIERTTKSYKLYVNRKGVNGMSGGTKYYRMHDNLGFVGRFNDLLTKAE